MKRFRLLCNERPILNDYKTEDFETEEAAWRYASATGRTDRNHYSVVEYWRPSTMTEKLLKTQKQNIAQGTVEPPQFRQTDTVMGKPLNPMKDNDPLSPNHYERLDPQPRDVTAAWELNFDLGSAVKYIARAGHKDPAKEVEDLNKAIECIKHHIGVLAFRAYRKRGQ